METGFEFTIRDIRSEDIPAITQIDAMTSGAMNSEHGMKRLKSFTEKRDRNASLGYVAIFDEKVIGYILAEARAWEFGSPVCGWIYALAVTPAHGRKGVALALSRQACEKFKSMGIHIVRTMVRKDHVELLSFLRTSGFRAGPFVQLELKL